MNIELIKKYKKEFDYFLEHGSGSVLVKYEDPSDAEEGYEDWHEDDDVFDSLEDYLIVINDEYVEFRKALTEGKIIEVFNDNYYKQLLRNEWVLMDSMLINTDIDIKHYRIKPEESKFKIGDWVVLHTGDIAKVVYVLPDGTGIDVYSKEYTYTTEQIADCKPWEPQQGEWCMFYKKKPKQYTIARFKELHYVDPSYKPSYRTSTGVLYPYCIPYLGELPCQ